MTRQQLAHKLRLLQDDMIEIATALDYYGGLDPAWKQHSQEMLGAAAIAGNWADNIDHEPS